MRYIDGPPQQLDSFLLSVLPPWWRRVDRNPEWQADSTIALAVAYGLLAFVAFLQLIRIQRRVPEYGWTTQKVFHLLNAFVCLLRCLVFALRGKVASLSTPVEQAVLLDLPGLLFFSTYTLLVLFWAEIFYQARNLPTALLRPLFFAANGIVYGVQMALWVYAACMRSTSAFDLVRAASCVFLALVSVVAALGFLVYGGRLFLMLRQFPIESRGRKKKLREVGCVTAICALCFTLRAVLAAWGAFDKAEADVDKRGHPLLALIYYTVCELLPSALVLYILRKLPPKRSAQGYQQIPVR